MIAVATSVGLLAIGSPILARAEKKRESEN
jgi:hypothetical protein